MTILLKFLLTLVFLSELSFSVEIEALKMGAPESLRVWSALKFLLKNDDTGVLSELYPVATGLQEDELDTYLSDGGGKVAELVASILSSKYNRGDLAALLPRYCDLYPMGMDPKYSFPSDGLGDISGKMFFELNGKRYESPDDVFYLKSSELKQQAQVLDSDIVTADEVVIGSNTKSPIVLFYGCPDVDGVYEDFNRNLYSEAIKTGKLRFVWRPTCVLENVVLDGFAMGVSLRSEDDLSVLPTSSLRIPEDFIKSKYRLHNLTPDDLAELDLKVASLIAHFYESSRDFLTSFEYMKELINNYPLLTDELVSLQMDISRVVQSHEKLKNVGVDYQMLGLYVNGQNMRISSLDQTTLLDAITSEYFRIGCITEILRMVDNDANTFKSKKLLSTFSQLSLPNLRELQPIKLDLHRIPGFSESIIYFNDVEVDSQYDDLSLDIKKFFEKSKFGEIPEYKRNWSELIFVIDFGDLDNADTKMALEGLNRAITVMSQGYPQRIGLLPLETGSSASIVRRIYELKDLDLLELEDYLKDLSSYRTPSFDANYSASGVSQILAELDITKTSIIINGEIYPFKKNTWHYLVAKVTKKDMTYLKKELSKYTDIGNNGIDVRDILHLKSANSRNRKYTPDYFSDATYSFTNISSLNAVEDRILYHFKGNGYNMLHTVTLVDDFNSKQALKRLVNLLETSFSGVRIRIFHVGSLSDLGWTDLKQLMLSNFSIKALKELALKSKDTIASKTVCNEIFFKWMPDLSSEYFSSSSFLVVNGRFIRFDEEEVPSKLSLDSIIKREAKRTLDVMYAIDSIYPSVAEDEVNSDFIEMASSALTKIFYQGTQLYQNGIEFTPEASMSRIDVSRLFSVDNFTIFQSTNRMSVVDVELLLDPLEERSQKILSLVESIYNLPFVNLKIVLFPTETLRVNPISRLYIDAPGLSSTDEWAENIQVELDVPSNFYLSNQNELEGIVIEVHAYLEDEPVATANVEGVGGLCLELINESNVVIDSCVTMTTFGYGQFIVQNLNENLRIRSCDSSHKVTSMATDARSDYAPQEWFAVRTFNPVRVHVQVAKENQDNDASRAYEGFNVFTVLQNRNEEDEYKRMVVSILLEAKFNTEQITFWILDQPFISKSFKTFCKVINENWDSPCKIQFLKYQWPLWLRPQRYITRRLDAFKVLFTDVLFPQNISKLIYMEPTSSPIDIFKVYNVPNFDTPLALYKMSGSGYWEEGYWANMLSKNRLKFYSMSPAILINLDEFRRLSYGDKLRLHYQRLTADPLSLVKIDQDLVNDLQLEVPVTELRLSQKKMLGVEKSTVDSCLRKLNALADHYTGPELATDHNSNFDHRNDEEDTLWHDEL